MIKRALVRQIGLYRRCKWVRKEASNLLRPGKYIYKDKNYKEMALRKISIPKYIFLYLFGRVININRSGGNGTKILFATNGKDFRIVAENTSKIFVISHTAERSRYLEQVHDISLPLPTAKILNRETEKIYVEKFIKNTRPDFLTSEMYSCVLDKYLQFYKNLQPKSPKVIQHRDLHPQNILWNKNQPEYVVDLEDAGEDWYLRDLMTLLVCGSMIEGNWSLLDDFFFGKFDQQFKTICRLFHETFNNDSHYLLLKKYLSIRYDGVDLTNEPELRYKINFCLERYKNFSGKKRRCAFSVCDERYVTKAAAALSSVRSHNPTLDLFLIGSHFSEDDKTKLQKNGIQFIELDEYDQLPVVSDYNKESYYYFAIPELLLKRGYIYSVYIDGDTVCCGNIDPAFQKISTSDKILFAGASDGRSYKEILAQDIPILRENFQIKTNAMRNRIHSGVIFFNNKNCESFQFKKKMIQLTEQINQLYTQLIRDNKLFAIFQFTNHPMLYCTLDQKYNFIEKFSSSKEIIFYHFTYLMPKPWLGPTKKRSLWFALPWNISIYFRWRKYAKRYLKFYNQLIK